MLIRDKRYNQVILQLDVQLRIEAATRCVPGSSMFATSRIQRFGIKDRHSFFTWFLWSLYHCISHYCMFVCLVLFENLPIPTIWLCLKMLCTPLYPMVLLIIIPYYPYEKWLAIIGNINPTFSGPNPLMKMSLSLLNGYFIGGLDPIFSNIPILRKNRVLPWSYGAQQLAFPGPWRGLRWGALLSAAMSFHSIYIIL